MTTEIPLYIPQHCMTLDRLGDSQIRSVFQGPAFSGKTTAALTFPNPVALSYDRKVTAHQHRKDVIVVPFFDPEFVDKIHPRSGTKNPPNRKDALITWLNTEGMKLSKEQTLIADNCSEIEKAYHTWFDVNKHLAVTKSGEKNEFIEWRLKNDYFDELHTLFKALKCNVIFIAHEAPDRDKKGELNGKFRPILTGQSGDKLGSNFTDYFRAFVITKPSTPEQMKKVKEWAKIDDSTLQEWVASTPPIHQSIYLWQTCEDEQCDCGTSSLRNCPKYILANYSSFKKYQQ